MVEEANNEQSEIIEKKKLKKILNMNVKDVVAIQRKKNKKRKSQQLNKDVICIDIDEKFMNIVIGKYFKHDIKIKQSIQRNTPDNCYEDGRIINDEFLYEELKSIIKENKIKAKYASFTSNSSLIINREILIPKAEDDELETVIRYEVEQYLPINLNDYIIQFLVLEEVMIGDIEKLKVHVICYPEKVALAYYKLIKRLKLKPLSLDITFNSLLKIVNHSRQINDKEYDINKVNGFIDIGLNSTEINIFTNQTLSFTRIIKIGYKDIIKDKVYDFEIDYFTSEVERVLQFYRNKTHGKNVDNIYLLGEGSRYDEISFNMKEKINANINPIIDMGYIGLEEDDDVYKFIKAIGALIRL